MRSQYPHACPPPPTPILKLTDIRKSYNVGTPVETEVLHGITLALREADFVALTGPEAGPGPWPSSLQLRMVAAPSGR